MQYINEPMRTTYALYFTIYRHYDFLNIQNVICDNKLYARLVLI